MKANIGHTVCLIVFIVAVTSLETLTHGMNSALVRKQRQAPNRVCGFEQLKCYFRRKSLCQNTGEQCVKVETILLPQPTCKIICQPILTTTIGNNLPANVTDATQNTTDVHGVFSNVTSVYQNISTDPSVVTLALVGNETNSTTPIVTRATTLHWTNDSSICATNLRCMNGGTCKNKHSQNPYCVCTPGWKGSFCHQPCFLKCGNNGTCTFLDKKQLCLCPPAFTGPRCEKIKPVKVVMPPEPPHPWFIYVIVFFALLVGILVGVMVLRTLRGRSLLVTKMFYYFQPYEDDDGKLFDAFISFKSSNSDFSQSDDEKFVVRTLHPKLEKELQFRICVHYRDFLPGETIANNIMWAVENSRRTILILSPNYLQSDWGRLEYQKAQQEMLQLRHKIIPIIIEDISSKTIEDPNLSHILSSVTYIEYPGVSDAKKEDRFWEMLQLALPKKRPQDNQSGSESSSSSSVPLHSSQTLMSQESWQSARTDVTEMSEDSPIEMTDVTVICTDSPVICTDSLVISPDISVVSPDVPVFISLSHTINMDQIGVKRSSVSTNNEKNEREQTLNENANKLIGILEEKT